VTAIYGLYDPRADVLRYVGKTIQSLERRLACHISEALHRDTDNHRLHWIGEVCRAGYRPGIFLIEETDDWEAAERKWIAYFRSLGANLVNATDGGEDSKSMSVASRAKMSEAAKRRISKMSLEEKQVWYAKLGASRRGKPKSPEHRAKIAAKSSLRKHSDATRKKISRARVGKPLSEAHKAKLRETTKRARAARFWSSWLKKDN